MKELSYELCLTEEKWQKLQNAFVEQLHFGPCELDTVIGIIEDVFDVVVPEEWETV